MRNRIKSRELSDQHIIYDLTDSTMNDMNAYIAQAIEQGADIHGHVIQALMQTNSRGSTDIKTGITREWKSQGGNLLFSMAVSISEIHQREVYLIGALALFEAIKSMGFDCQKLKMEIPNDIYIDGKKICGVLTSPEFCNGLWCNMGVGVNTAFAPPVTDGRNVSGCLADYGWSEDQKPEAFLSLFMTEFEKHYQAQLKDSNYVFKALGLMNSDGLIYAYDKDNPHQWAVGRFKNFETHGDGHDYLIIEDATGIDHSFLFLRTEILNPDHALQYHVQVYITAQKGMQHG